jgi:hypothetical protein
MGTPNAAERHILYKQYGITATSFRRVGGWVPQAEVNDGREAGMEVHTLEWKGAHTFPTRQIADQRALALAKHWVDERG